MYTSHFPHSQAMYEHSFRQGRSRFSQANGSDYTNPKQQPNPVVSSDTKRRSTRDGKRTHESSRYESKHRVDLSKNARFSGESAAEYGRESGRRTYGGRTHSNNQPDQIADDLYALKGSAPV